ncbi:uncharacterized protein N7483_010786 [Penicillium malachiteum]|uniref:uncharacterized protein n=1 Tax=Penicillium malachiteum TaxID=1324776 RepID=UPI00254669EF|nr:uncharacterized protein N7483_010786 [Penicillium malachiteum]KAJ5713605.1 hypothetical protein N7483_010786 [Penicillium malachiteum]
MECFRQVFRCFKAPFTRRNTGTVIEIGPPTNFRKEELPACFSDAESVISPNQNPIEPPILTKELQHVDVSGQPGSDTGEGRDDDRNGGSTASDRGQDSGSCAGNEHLVIKPNFRERMKPTRWFKSTKCEARGEGHKDDQEDGHEINAMKEI